jgi:YVTN family beta-propeller protein
MDNSSFIRCPIFPMKISLCFLLVLSALLAFPFTSRMEAAASAKVAATFSAAASRFTADPVRGYIYASVRDDNTVMVIDPSTLTVVKTLTVGASPIGMSISPDGAKLYVALVGAKKIAIVDLDTLTLLPSLTISQIPYFVAAGLNNQLYVSAAEEGDDLLEVDATTGATEAVFPGLFDATGFVVLNPARNRLFFGDSNSSLSMLTRYDVTTTPPTLVEQTPLTRFQGFGVDLKLSHDAQLLCFPTGNGDDGKGDNDILNPLDFTQTYGTIDFGFSPNSFDFTGPVAFSPGDKVVYQSGEPDGGVYEIDFFDTTTFTEFATIPSVPQGSENLGIRDLITDNTGRYLFVATSSIVVYDLDADITDSVTETIGASFTYQAPVYIYAPTVTATGLPKGLTFNAATRTISGTLTEAGLFPIVIKATGAGKTVTDTLTVSVYPDSRALNISTRALVQTGDSVLIAGFIILGDTNKEVVVRAIGPSLSSNGVPFPGRLLDPTLSVFDSSGALLFMNDDWQRDPSSFRLMQLNLAPTDPLESALDLTLAPGAYTLVMSGVDGGTGIGLAEVYDIASGEADDPRLGNISTRGSVQTGDNVMIAGFILDGTPNASMLVRGLGPSLAMQGVSGVLSDPQLELHNSDGTTIASNDNWQDTQETLIEATGLAPTDPAESAIDTTLPPGAYTAILSGVGGTTGVGLVEVYNLP